MKQNKSASNTDIGLSFFYATKEADFYDDIVNLTQKDYEISHNTLIELLDYHIQNNEQHINILDIGCGTGREAIEILNRFLNASITAMDFSQEMLDVFINKSKNNYQNRLRIICEDINEVDNLVEFNNEKKYDIIISAYTLHHYNLLEKEVVYSKIFDALEANGLFMNLDLASYQSSILSIISQKQIEDFIISQFENLPRNIKEILVNKNVNIKKLMKDWIEHVSKVNIPLIIDSKSGHSENETEILHKIGFSEVGIPYRNFQSAILWAKK